MDFDRGVIIGIAAELTVSIVSIRSERTADDQQSAISIHDVNGYGKE